MTDHCSLNKGDHVPGRDVIVIGASAGGVEALTEIVRALPPGFPAAVFVVCHFPPRAPTPPPPLVAPPPPPGRVRAAAGDPQPQGAAAGPPRARRRADLPRPRLRRRA